MMTYTFKLVHCTCVVKKKKKKIIQEDNYKNNQKNLAGSKSRKKSSGFQHGTLGTKKNNVAVRHRIRTKRSNFCSPCSHEWSPKHNSLAGASQYTQQGLAGAKNMLPQEPCKGTASLLSFSVGCPE